jgi:hypothetical protein
MWKAPQNADRDARVIAAAPLGEEPAMPCIAFRGRESAFHVDLRNLSEFGNLDSFDQRSCPRKTREHRLECLRDVVVDFIKHDVGWHRQTQSLQRTGLKRRGRLPCQNRIEHSTTRNRTGYWPD